MPVKPMGAVDTKTVIVTDNGDGTMGVQIGPMGYTLDLEELRTLMSGGLDPWEFVKWSLALYLTEKGIAATDVAVVKAAVKKMALKVLTV